MKILVWEARRSRNVTLIELAAKCGISKSTISNIENERTSPTLHQLEALAKALETTISELYDSPYK